MEPTALIRDKIDLISFIGEFVTLKKAGRNFKGLCPFHSESTPSFVVSPERQIWHCFGCQKGGDCFTFLMEYEKMEFPEALRVLAQRTGIELPTSRFSSQSASKKEKLYQMNKDALKFYHYLLTTHKVGMKAKAYILNRGINERVIETYQVGFAPNIGDALINYMIKKHKYTKDDLMESGLGTNSRSGVIDFFRGRLLFPLIDHRDNVVGFAGRILEESDSVKAKYINTRDTLIYHKGESVFGLNISKETIRKENQAILVEGEFDVLSCFQHGITNVVAIKGTALTEPQVALLSRYAQKITICFDGDKAGQEALKRSLPLLEKKGLTTTVIVIPDGKDPDEALKISEIAFKKAATHDVPVYDYLLTQLLKEHNPSTLDGKREISNVLLPFLWGINNEIIKEHYFRKVSQEIDTSYESLMKEGEKLVKKDREVLVKTDKKEKRSRDETLEEYLLALVLQSKDVPQSSKEVSGMLGDDIPHARAYQKIFVHLVSYLREHETFDSRQFGDGLPKELEDAYSISLLLPLPTSVTEGEEINEMKATAVQLKAIYRKQKLKELGQEIKKREAEGDEDGVEKLRVKFSALVTELKK